MLENASSDTVNLQTRKWSSYTTFMSLLGWSSIQTGKIWIRWRIITNLLTNCIEMLVFGTWWKTRHSVVCQQTCKSSHNMDSDMRQTIGKIDFIHSSHKGIPTELSCGQHCSALLTGFISRPRLWSYVYSEAEHLDRKFDVQEANVSVSQFHRIGSYFFGFWFANGWTACFRSLGHGDWSVTFDKEHCKTWQTCPRRLVRDSRPCHQKKQNKGINWDEKARCWALVKRGLRTHQHAFFSRRVSVVHVWRQRSCHQDDYPRTKSNNETRVQNLQSWAWLVVRRNQLGTKEPNQICWRQKPTCWHSNPRGFSRDDWNHLLRSLKNEFSMFSCSHFSNFLSDRKAERHVKERSRNDFQWRFTDGEDKTNGSSEGETSQLGFTPPVEREGKSLAGFGISGQPGERRWRTRWSYSSTRRLGRTTQNPEVERSQVRRQENAQSSDSLKQCDQEELQTLPVQGDLYGQRLQEQIFEKWSTRTFSTWRRSSISDKRSWELQQATQHSQWKH